MSREHKSHPAHAEAEAEDPKRKAGSSAAPASATHRGGSAQLKADKNAKHRLAVKRKAQKAASTKDKKHHWDDDGAERGEEVRQSDGLNHFLRTRIPRMGPHGIRVEDDMGPLEGHMLGDAQHDPLDGLGIDRGPDHIDRHEDPLDGLGIDRGPGDGFGRRDENPLAGLVDMNPW